MASRIIKHPVTQIVIGVILSAAFFYLVEQKEVKPRYAVSEPETLAEATADAPGLKLLWEDNEIENIHTIDIVIWNAGRQFLDKSAISATDPIRVTYPPDVQILYAKFVRTSRDSLEFVVTDLANTGIMAMQIEIVGDEALERTDGGLLRILFSGPSANDFVVTGRIKGSREGFKKIDLDETLRQSVVFLVLVLSIPLVMMFLSSRMMESEALSAKLREWKGSPSGWQRALGYLVTIMFVVLAVVIMAAMYLAAGKIAGSLRTTPPWLP